MLENVESLPDGLVNFMYTMSLVTLRATNQQLGGICWTEVGKPISQSDDLNLASVR